MNTNKRKGAAKQTIVRLYACHTAMVKKLAKKLEISESEVMRGAIELRFKKQG